MTVFFHGNFGMNRARMARLAMLASEGPSRSDADLASEFGYGAPFAATYRSWLHKVGIAELRKPFRLTRFGRVILDCDPEFDEPATKWFLHHELTGHPTRAETWRYFYKEFRPKHRNFSKEDLMKGLMRKLRSHSEKQFGPNSKMNPVIVRKLLECYTQNEALGELKILQRRSDGDFDFLDAKPLGPWDSETEFLQALKADREEN